MKVIVFDTETSGLPSTTNIPTIVQFSYVKFDMETGRIEKEVDFVIEQPTGFVIPEEAINIHRVTNEMCAEKGVPILGVLNQFVEDTEDCFRVIGHNIQFDMDRVASVFNKMTNSKHPEDIRKFYERKLKYMAYQMQPKTFCTMKKSIEFCSIMKTSASGKQYKKFPKLVELYETLFACKPTGLHNSLVDVYACLRCYVALVNGGQRGNDSDIMNRMNALENLADLERINQENIKANMEDGV
jgi:DNA polymerase III epsilon subunit-like protein